jgi:hypothetical protein
MICGNEPHESGGIEGKITGREVTSHIFEIFGLANIASIPQKNIHQLRN